MRYKQVRVRESTYKKLILIAGILQIRYGKKFSISDVIDYMIEQQKIVELKI
ncbi:MAG: hypothetical protein QW795_07275 [Candidatus Bathyarchaeia archaeon]